MRLGGTVGLSFRVKMVLEVLTWLGLAGWYWWDASAFDDSHFRLAVLAVVYFGPIIIACEYLRDRRRQRAASAAKALVLFLLVVPSDGAQAQAGDQVDPVPDLVACLTLIEPLDLAYRNRMQSACITEAAEVCGVGRSGPVEECLRAMTLSVREEFDAVFPLLPAEISDRGFSGRGYARGVARLRSDLDDLTFCAAEEDTRYVGCELGVTVAVFVQLLFRARQSGTALP